jgi:hypothetical protein
MRPVLRKFTPIVLMLAAVLQGLSGSVVAQEGAADAAAEVKPDESFTPSLEFQAWMCRLVRVHLPDHYEKSKNWGHTTRTLDGLSVQLDRGKLKTHRKYKEANDGTWQMYRIDLVDPEEKFDIRIASLRPLEDGRVGMQITAVASVKAVGRQALWERGVQIFSLAAEADARVRLVAETAVATQLDPTKLPPDVYLRPEVTAARFEILEFKLRRISDLHGPIIRSLSHSVREVLEDKLAEDNAKLVAKLNKAIDKEEEKLKLSAADLVSMKWTQLSAPPAAPAAAESRPAGE